MNAAAIAIAGIAAPTLLGGFGLWLQHRAGQASRVHARKLAQDERLFRVKADAYEQILGALHARERAVRRWHPGEQLPPPPNDDEMARLDAIVGIFAPDDVRYAVTAFGDAVFAFRARAGQFATLAPPQRLERGEYLEEGRSAVIKHLLRIERLMRDDLGVVPMSATWSDEESRSVEEFTTR